MYRYNGSILFSHLPKDEPLDIYIMKRGAQLIAAAVTDCSYQAVRVTVENGIRDVPDFTRLCVEHNFHTPKTKKPFCDLRITIDMCDDLCTVNEYPCQPAALPDQLVDCLAG